MRGQLYPLRYSNLSDDYFQAGVPGKEIELLSQGIKIDPRQVHFVILSNMGRAQFMAGDDDAAIQWSLRAIDVNPTFALQHAYLKLRPMYERAILVAPRLLQMK